MRSESNKNTSRTEERTDCPKLRAKEFSNWEEAFHKLTPISDIRALISFTTKKPSPKKVPEELRVKTADPKAELRWELLVMTAEFNFRRPGGGAAQSPQGGGL
ncbi:hypothetical protein Q3G72_012760 [Acer saccharum]|nr:hypothetical protein Q3G72_012760 [Acer saccharum]